MQFTYVNDLVTAMVKAADEPRAVGEAFNIGDPKPVTQVELVEKLHPDLVILDFSMPRINGQETAKAILRLAPRSKIIISTVHRVVNG